MFEDLLDLLKNAGVDPAAQQITLMRHKDKRYPLVKYIGTRALNLYQAMQPREMPVGSLLVAFYGNRPGHALLLGVWRVDGVLSPGEQCDDANPTSNDGCSANCVIEPNWVCPDVGKPCVSRFQFLPPSVVLYRPAFGPHLTIGS